MLISKIVKPWGYEEILEQNENYVVKRLFMKAGAKCSLQYHEFKHETFVVIFGKLKFYYGNDIKDIKTIELTKNQHFVVPVGLIHRMEGIEDSIYVECSTNHLTDVVRVEDEYGRK